MALYDEIAALDRNLADRWKIRMRGKMDKPVLTAADVDFIVSDIVRSFSTESGITQKQGEALILLSNASIEADGRKSEAGIRRLDRYVNAWDKALRLNLQFVTDDNVSLFVEALSNELVTRIAFKSPGTKISYVPSDYIAVGQLMIRKDLTVMFSQSGGLGDRAKDSGKYLSNANIMILNHAMNRRITLVHEATHVIQDWKDVKALTHHNEADAFIAQSIARIASSANVLAASEFDSSTVEGAALTAARMVVENKAGDTNRDWQKGYATVVAAVARRYKKPGHRDVAVERNEGNSELTKFSNILAQIDMMRKAVAFASSLWP